MSSCLKTTSPATAQDVLERLEAVRQIEAGRLRGEVAEIVLGYADNDDELRQFLEDLRQGGCISGMVGPLIYYCDSHAFFDRHYDDIEALRQDLEDDHGYQLTVQGDLKNFYAWLAFEETAFRLAGEFGIDLWRAWGVAFLDGARLPLFVLAPAAALGGCGLRRSACPPSAAPHRPNSTRGS